MTNLLISRTFQVSVAVMGLLIFAVNPITKRHAREKLTAYSGEFDQEVTPNATALSMPKMPLEVQNKAPLGVLLIPG
jgi:hypothetical protein